MPQEFWSWAKWKDQGSQGWLPPDVRRYFLARGWSKAPATWKARYLIHRGAEPFPKPDGWVMGQRCIYMSGGVTDQFCQWFAGLGNKHTVLFSADANLKDTAYHVTDAQIAICRSGGGKVASWCDSSQTPYYQAELMAAQRNLDFPSGQAETCDQWRQSMDRHAPLVIGEPSSLREQGCLGDAINRTVNREVRFIGEMLHPQRDYSAQGVPISSVCVYVDMDEGHGGYQPLSDFAVINAAYLPTLSVYTGGRMSDEDRRLYRAWTV